MLLATTPHMPAGLLTVDAWAALHDADVVVTTGPGQREHATTARGRVVDGTTLSAADAATLLGSPSSTVLWCSDGDDADDVLATMVAAAAATGTAVERIEGAPDLPGARLLDLVAVMDRLRSPGGCPWDARQTHASLVEYLVEEAYETVEAIETEDDDALREELGDLLLQVVFHARLAQEHARPWSVDDVADGIVAKLVSRHPHVFGDGDATTAEQVEATWAQLKSAEKGRESVTDGIPLALPSLVLATKLLRRSEPVGLEPAPEPVRSAADSAVAAVGGDYGPLLLALVARARADGVDPEAALREAVRDHRARVRVAEGLTP